MSTTEATMSRLWRPRTMARVAIPLLLVFILASIDKRRAHLPTPWPGGWQDPTHYGLILASALIAAYAVRAFTQALGAALEGYLGLGRARSAATLVSLILYGIVIVVAIDATTFDLSGFLVGGAVTGVIVGIAAQASLANLIAGLVILFARPYSAGMYVTVRAGAFGGVEYGGQVWDVGLFYTTLHSEGKEIRIPNSTMVAAVIVQRPQELDLSIPITLPRAADLPACLELLRRSIAGCTAARRTALVTLESVTEAGYVVSVRVSVAGETERRAVEGVIAGVARQEQEAQSDIAVASPTPAPFH